MELPIPVYVTIEELHLEFSMIFPEIHIKERLTQSKHELLKLFGNALPILWAEDKSLDYLAQQNKGWKEVELSSLYILNMQFSQREKMRERGTIET